MTDLTSPRASQPETEKPAVDTLMQGVYGLVFYSAEADHPQVRGTGNRYITRNGARLYCKVSGVGPQFIYVDSSHEIYVPKGVAFERPWRVAPAGTSQFVEPQITVVFNTLDF